MDVDAGQSCSQGATENCKCVWENRVIGKSRKGNQKTRHPKANQMEWFNLAWRQGDWASWWGLVGRRGWEERQRYLLGRQLSKESMCQHSSRHKARSIKGALPCGSPKSPMFRTLPWQLKADCAGPGQPWPRGIGADIEPSLGFLFHFLSTLDLTYPSQNTWVFHPYTPPE